MATRRIKFIGNTPYKKDNVCRSNLFWPYPGAIVEAPEDIASRLMAHKDVWVEADPDDKGEPSDKDKALSLGENLTRDERIDIAIGIIKEQDCLMEVMAHFEGDDVGPPDDDLSELNSETDGLVDAPPIPEKPKQAPVVAFSLNRDEAVVQAINALNRDSDRDFTKEGVPRVEAISGLLGYEITAAERTSAWDTVMEGEGN